MCCLDARHFAEKCTSCASCVCIRGWIKINAGKIIIIDDIEEKNDKDLVIPLSWDYFYQMLI